MQTFETKIHRLEWFAHVILISVTPILQNLRICLRKRRNGKSDVPVKQRGGWPKIYKNQRRQIKAAFFSPSENRCLPAPSNLKPEEREFVVDSGASMHMISKKGLEFCWMGNRDDIEKSDDGYNSQWWSADAWRGHSLRQELDFFFLEETPAVLSLGKFCDEHGYSYEWINGQKPHLKKNGIRI